MSAAWDGFSSWKKSSSVKKTVWHARARHFALFLQLLLFKDFGRAEEIGCSGGHWLVLSECSRRMHPRNQVRTDSGRIFDDRLVGHCRCRFATVLQHDKSGKTKPAVEVLKILIWSFKRPKLLMDILDFWFFESHMTPCDCHAREVLHANAQAVFFCPLSGSAFWHENPIFRYPKKAEESNDWTVFFFLGHILEHFLMLLWSKHRIPDL